MWIYLNNSFLSIVHHKNKEGVLVVRARVEGDIEKVFPHAHASKGLGTDYLYRAYIPVEEVAEAIAGAVKGIFYTNFKDDVFIHDKERHDKYFQIWRLTARELQNRHEA